MLVSLKWYDSYHGTWYDRSIFTGNRYQQVLVMDPIIAKIVLDLLNTIVLISKIIIGLGLHRSLKQLDRRKGQISIEE